VSNQSGIARGMFDTDTLAKIHAKMIEAIRAKGGEIEAIFFCPHGPDDGCGCRKPQPGNHAAAAAELRLDVASSIVIGDKPSDVELGVNAGPGRFEIFQADIASALGNHLPHDRASRGADDRAGGEADHGPGRGIQAG